MDVRQFTTPQAPPKSIRKVFLFLLHDSMIFIILSGFTVASDLPYNAFRETPGVFCSGRRGNSFYLKPNCQQNAKSVNKNKLAVENLVSYGGFESPSRKRRRLCSPGYEIVMFSASYASAFTIFTVSDRISYTLEAIAAWEHTIFIFICSEQGSISIFDCSSVSFSPKSYSKLRRTSQ